MVEVGARSRVRSGLGWTGVAGTALLACWVLGPDGALVLLGAVSLAAGVTRVAGSLRGPAAWAWAIVGETVLIVGAGALAAVVCPAAQGQVLQRATLALPLALGVTLWLTGRHARRRLRLPGAVPWSLTVGVLAVAAVVQASGPYHAISWAMAGDGRNHALIIRSIIADGGLTLHQGLEYPALVDAVAAALAGAAGRNVSAGQLLVVDATAIARTYVLSAIAVAVLLAGAVLAFVGVVGRNSRALQVVALVAGVAAGSPLVLGYALADGFLSAYGTIPLVLSSVVLMLAAVASPRSLRPAWIGLLLLVALVAESWTIVAVLPLAALLVVTTLAVLQRRGGRGGGSTVGFWLLTTLSVVMIGGAAGGVVVRRHQLAEQFVAEGSAGTVSMRALAVLLLILVAVVFAASDRVRHRALATTVLAVVGVSTVAVLVLLPAGGPAWTYYGRKTAWLLVVALVWVGFVPVALWAAGPRRSGISRSWSAVAASLAVLITLSGMAAVADPLPTALAGRTSVSPAVLGPLVRAADAGREVVFWSWSDDFGYDRMGNFWSALTWSPAADQADLAAWAYSYDGEIDGLCQLAARHPNLVVLTHDRSLEAATTSACGRSMTVVVGA